MTEQSQVYIIHAADGRVCFRCDQEIQGRVIGVDAPDHDGIDLHLECARLLAAELLAATKGEPTP